MTRLQLLVVTVLVAGCVKGNGADMGVDAGADSDADPDPASDGEVAVFESPTASCDVTNGVGLVYSGVCRVDTCRSGYAVDLDSNSCRPADVPSLTVSSRRVAPGNEIWIAWNGGARAASCRVYLSDATRTNYEPWGALPPTGNAAVAVSSDTLFNMICTDAAAQELQNATALVRIDNAASRAVYLGYMAGVGRYRHALWDHHVGDWEVWYDGAGTPADAVPMAFVWDNPIDDDGLAEYQNGFGFRFDTLGDSANPGFVTIDRATNETQRHKGASFHRRDEFLRRAFGFTLEFRAKLFLNSGYYPETNTYEDSFNAYYQMEDGTTIGLFLTPYTLKAGGYNAPRLGSVPTVNMDTTVFNTYRIVQYPGSSHFYVYVNDNPQPILEADGNQYPIGSWTNHDDPIVIVGGESVSRSHFTLDYVRYRRGAYPPGAAMSAPLSRSPSALPEPLPSTMTEGWVANAGAFSAQGFAYDAYGIFHSLSGSPLSGCTQGWTQESNGTLGYHGNSETCMIRQVPGLVGKGDVTIEARLKVLPTSQPRGFSFSLSDQMGTVSVMFSPTKVETGLGFKNVGWRDIGIQAAPMNTTDDFHVYRLVRRAHQLYAHLYVDDNPIPAIFDQHIEASTNMTETPTGVYLGFGAVHRPGPTLQGEVQIDYIRWAPTAFAPPL
jgi:hypothetical protein